jgi:2-polyprenyl-3-methyl-5-hydroxy-6-metoxy-1,4-benzoquinol methylase
MDGRKERPGLPLCRSTIDIPSVLEFKINHMRHIKDIIYGFVNWKPARKVFSLLPISYLKVTKDTWDKEYREGRWEYLNTQEQHSRYSTIARCIQRRLPGGSILDIACGEGILLNCLDSSQYSEYMGIDFSEAVIAKARLRQYPKASFLQADAMLFQPDRKFDVIIFNECLYYFKKPMSLLRHYEAFLTPDGFFIVSMYSTRGTGKIWKKISALYITIEETALSHKSGAAWQVRVLEAMRKDGS